MNTAEATEAATSDVTYSDTLDATEARTYRDALSDITEEGRWVAIWRAMWAALAEATRRGET